MREENEELNAARREIECLTREVARLREELETQRARQEIDEHSRVEQELRESEQRFRELFDLLPASISFTRKSDHVFLEVNHGFEVGSGYRRDEVIGRSARELKLW